MRAFISKTYNQAGDAMDALGLDLNTWELFDEGSLRAGDHRGLTFRALVIFDEIDPELEESILLCARQGSSVFRLST